MSAPKKRESTTSVAWQRSETRCRACRAIIVVYVNPNAERPPARTLCAPCLSRTFARARLH